MTMPDDYDHRDVSPVAHVSAQQWEQAGPVGGGDFDGRQATRAQTVTVSNLVQVREVPTLGATTVTVPTSLTEPKRLIGRAPQRRMITIVCDQDVWIATDSNTAQNGQGFLLPASTPFPTGYAGEIWIRAKTVAGTATAWAELDQG